jgi:hypothetical protein
MPNLYNSAPVLCRKCLEIPVGERELAEALDKYLDELPDEVKVSPEVYEARLSICADCARRVGYTCMACGCYCQARAAKRKLTCAEGKWEIRRGVTTTPRYNNIDKENNLI